MNQCICKYPLIAKYSLLIIPIWYFIHLKFFILSRPAGSAGRASLILKKSLSDKSFELDLSDIDFEERFGRHNFWDRFERHKFWANTSLPGWRVVQCKTKPKWTITMLGHMMMKKSRWETERYWTAVGCWRCKLGRIRLFGFVSSQN